MIQSVGDSGLWIIFVVVVLGAFYWDMRDLMREHGDTLSFRHALARSLAWVGLAFFFWLILWGYLFFRQGALVAANASSEFLTAYLIEKSLSFDNLFVILMIFFCNVVSISLRLCF